MKTNKKTLFFKSFFILIIVYIIISIFLTMNSISEDFSFKMGTYEEFNKDWYCENTGEYFDCPNVFEEIAQGEELVISKRIPQDLEKINCLEFRTFQGSCKVYIDGELRQEYGNEPYRVFSQFPPSAEILVDLLKSDAGKTIEIRFLCKNKNYIGTTSSVHIGEKDAVLRQMMRKHFPLIVAAIILAIFGIVCILTYYLVYRESKKNKYIVYLGMFLTIMGLWIFSSSRIRQLFIGNITAIQYLELWMVHIIPIPIIFFCDLRCGGRYRKFSNIMLLICYADFVISNILHFTGICDKAYQLPVAHSCCFIVALYFIICNIMDFRRGYKKESTQICIAFLVMVAFSFLDVFMLYVDRQWAIGFYISVGVLCFSFIVLLFSIQDYILESRLRTSIIAESEAKEHFFATMSHDIRTPINAIIGMNEMIQRESKEDSTQEYSRDIERASETLMSIVNNILDFSKIRDGKYEIVNGEFLFAPMIADVIKMTSSLAEKKKLKFITTVDSSIPLGLIGDENAIKRILTNLLSNAIKYTKEGSVEFVAKTLSSKNISPNNCCIRFEIRDTGIGIKKEDIPHIFDVFSRMDGEKNKNVQGTGLGLAITNALASSMGSEIKVSSVYGEGSVFSFDMEFEIYKSDAIGEFSLEAAKKADVDNEHKKGPASEKGIFCDSSKRLLVVDDTSMNLIIMKRLLEINKVQVITAESGDECIDYVQKESFDMILLDDLMPGKDGRETFAELKEKYPEAIKGIPVIALTANAGPGVRETYINLGFNDYMSKPVKTDSLNEMLWKYFG